MINKNITIMGKKINIKIPKLGEQDPLGKIFSKIKAKAM